MLMAKDFLGSDASQSCVDVFLIIYNNSREFSLFQEGRNAVNYS